MISKKEGKNQQKTSFLRQRCFELNLTLLRRLEVSQHKGLTNSAIVSKSAFIARNLGFKFNIEIY